MEAHGGEACVITRWLLALACALMLLGLFVWGCWSGFFLGSAGRPSAGLEWSDGCATDAHPSAPCEPTAP